MNPTQEFILRTDALATAIRAVLAQQQDSKDRMTKRPLGFYLPKLHNMEIQCPTYDRELLVIYDALEHLSCYVQGQLKTTIYMDHALLQHVLYQQKLSS
jgi:hypothetical protein